MNSKLKLGELFLYKDEWKVCFSCSECGLEVEEIEQFVVHSLEHRLVVPTDDIFTLMRQVNGIKNDVDVFEAGNENKQVENDSRDCAILVEDDIDPLISKMDSFDDVLSAHMSDEEPDSDSESLLNDIGLITPPPPSPSPSVSNQSYEITNGQYKCHLCPKTYGSHRAVQRHQRYHRNRTYTCKTCGTSIKDYSNYSVHMKRHMGIKSHTCDLCGKCFTTSTELTIHKRSHTGERPYACKECDKTFTVVSHLASHRRRHRNERLYVCTHCGKSFFTLGLLREHERSHNTDRSYVCQKCNKSFKRRSAYDQHRKLHEEKKYICQLCGNKFAQYAGLYSHMKSHNKKAKAKKSDNDEEQEELE